jgi:hypothetical protein
MHSIEAEKINHDVMPSLLGAISDIVVVYQGHWLSSGKLKRVVLE